MAKCPKIDRKVTFYYEREHIGRLRPEPISPQSTTKSLEELLAHRREPVFIDVWGDKKCLYVFRGNQSAMKKALFGDLPSPRPQSMLTRPVDLEMKISGKDDEEGIYFPGYLYFNPTGKQKDQALFMLDYTGLIGSLWYLVETGSLNRVLGAANQLAQEWRVAHHDPSGLFEIAKEQDHLYDFSDSDEAQLSMLRGSTEFELEQIDEALELELNHFLEWLEQNYPSLYSEIDSPVTMLSAEEIETLFSDHTYLGFSVSQSYLSAAAVARVSGITIFPVGMVYLTSGYYLDFTSTMVHEVGHLNSLANNASTAFSLDFFRVSLKLYAKSFDNKDRRKLLDSLRSQAISSGVWNAQPVEEIWAETQDLAFIYDQGETASIKDNMFHYYEKNWKLLENYFPRSLLYMVWDYLTQKLQDHPHPLNALLMNDMDARIKMMEAYPAFDPDAPDPNDNMAYQELRDTFGLDSSLSE